MKKELLDLIRDTKELLKRDYHPSHAFFFNQSFNMNNEFLPSKPAEIFDGFQNNYSIEPATPTLKKEDPCHEILKEPNCEPQTINQSEHPTLSKGPKRQDHTSSSRFNLENQSPQKTPSHHQPKENIPIATAATSTRSDNMEELFSFFSSHPILKVTQEIPDDSLAKDIAQLWKHPLKGVHVCLLYIKGNPKEELFFKNLVQAISLRLKPAALVEASGLDEEKTWNSFLLNTQLKWILCTESTLSSLKLLKSHYRKLPATNQHFLDKTPLVLLEPFSSYASSGPLKKQLWEKLCQILKD